MGSLWVDLKSDGAYEIRISKLNMESFIDRRFLRGVVFSFSEINGQYDINCSDKLLFCKDRDID